MASEKQRIEIALITKEVMIALINQKSVSVEKNDFIEYFNEIFDAIFKKTNPGENINI